MLSRIRKRIQIQRWQKFRNKHLKDLPSAELIKLIVAHLFNVIFTSAIRSSHILWNHTDWLDGSFRWTPNGHEVHSCHIIWNNTDWLDGSFRWTPNGHEVHSSHIIWKKTDWLDGSFRWTPNGHEVHSSHIIWNKTDWFRWLFAMDIQRTRRRLRLNHCMKLVQSFFWRSTTNQRQQKRERQQTREKRIQKINAVLTHWASNKVVLS